MKSYFSIIAVWQDVRNFEDKLLNKDEFFRVIIHSFASKKSKC